MAGLGAMPPPSPPPGAGSAPPPCGAAPSSAHQVFHGPVRISKGCLQASFHLRSLEAHLHELLHSRFSRCTTDHCGSPGHQCPHPAQHPELVQELELELELVPQVQQEA
eukprot:Skav233668  [mRNA]  locus=scaffold976:153708:157158:+ [translate_table: standard]